MNDEVNVERSLLGRNSGHFVQGHVDDTGSIQVLLQFGVWCLYRSSILKKKVIRCG